MKELWLDFWTKKSAAVRAGRLIVTLAGAVLMSGTVPFPPEWTPFVRAAGGALTVIGPLITGRDK